MEPVNIKCFGVLREYSQAGQIALVLSPGMSVREVKIAVVEHMQQHHRHFALGDLILRHTALGAGDDLLSDDSIVGEEMLTSLCLLPPVSGG